MAITTLGIEIEGAEIHICQAMIPILNSIVHTCNKELKLRECFLTMVHFLEEKVKVLGRHL